MFRNVVGPLLAAVLGFFCGIGANTNNGAVQLVSIIVISVAGSLAIYLVATKYINVFMFYCLAISGGAILSVIAYRAWGV